MSQVLQSKIVFICAKQKQQYNATKEDSVIQVKNVIKNVMYVKNVKYANVYIYTFVYICIYISSAIIL